MNNNLLKHNKNLIKKKKYNLNSLNKFQTTLLKTIPKKQIKRIENLVWGMGIEHEVQLYHMPSNKHKICDFMLFDTEAALNRLLKKYSKGEIHLTNDEHEFLLTIPFEQSGRVCNGKFVVKPVPYDMPEFITAKPFCTLYNMRDITFMQSNIWKERNTFINLLMKESRNRQLIKKYGELTPYPVGMSRYIKVGHEKKLYTDYTGSYHVTITLPHDNKITNEQFIKIHQRFANQIQWIEPLLLTAFFSCDQDVINTTKKRVFGSYRVMLIGWGNLAGTDIRLFKKGIGRYAKSIIYWRKGLIFDDIEKLYPCYKASPSAIKEGAITSLSSNFRTFGSVDKNRPEHRVSGAPLRPSNGVELRIFDRFNEVYITQLTFLLSLIAENSKNMLMYDHVYQNKYWIKTIHNIMEKGHVAQLTKEYIQLLRRNLGLKIKTQNMNSFDVLQCIQNELYEKNKKGDWFTLMNTQQAIKLRLNNNKKHLYKLKLPHINSGSWQYAFIIKMNIDTKLCNNFKQLLAHLITLKQPLLYDTIKECITKQKMFICEIDDVLITNIIYFIHDNMGGIITKNKDGTINNIQLNKMDIHFVNKFLKYKNTNELILRYMNNEAPIFTNLN